MGTNSWFHYTSVLPWFRYPVFTEFVDLDAPLNQNLHPWFLGLDLLSSPSSLTLTSRRINVYIYTLPLAKTLCLVKVNKPSKPYQPNKLNKPKNLNLVSVMTFWLSEWTFTSGQDDHPNKQTKGPFHAGLDLPSDQGIKRPPFIYLVLSVY